jgi:ABC-type bacteriocin/lantibiotic exporter with double-glycine peptidase domain
MLNIFSTVSQHNSIAVTQQLLNSLQVPFTFGTIKDSIKQHPDYPSIAAVHDTLKEYKVDNLVLQTGPDKLDELPLPFIAHVKGKSAGFITVTMVTANEITYFKKDSLHDTVTTNRDEGLQSKQEKRNVGEFTPSFSDSNRNHPPVFFNNQRFNIQLFLTGYYAVKTDGGYCYRFTALVRNR